MSAVIDTEALSNRYRSAAIDIPGRRILVTNFLGTAQERDLTEPANCRGFGRIRHFRRGGNGNWPQNPLPIEPASKALGLTRADQVRAQVFQNAVCNWRCWYCFVPFNLLSANPKHAGWLTPAELVDCYRKQADPPRIIDLSGGQPDLTPEWIPWMMRELRSQGMEGSVYLWSDDNLSGDYFWRFLAKNEQNLIGSYRNYGRVGCFKGFNDESFAFNTSASPGLFANQFAVMKRLLESGLDIYAYVTLTAPSRHNLADEVCRFLDRLQSLDECLPLRTVPLEVQEFGSMQARVREQHVESLQIQHSAIEVWCREIERRYTSHQRTLQVCDVPLRRTPRDE